MGTPAMLMHKTGNPVDVSAVAATTDALDRASPPGNTREAQDDDHRDDTSNYSGNSAHRACLPFWWITCMLVSAVVVCCIYG
jgi:hypothetical protein